MPSGQVGFSQAFTVPVRQSRPPITGAWLAREFSPVNSAPQEFSPSAGLTFPGAATAAPKKGEVRAEA
jgi:hypothetical protein